MINSLFKDSHITQSLFHSNLYDSGSHTKQNKKREKSSSVTVNISSGRIANKNKPAEISFSGLSCPQGAEKVSKLYTSKAVKRFLEKAVDNQVLFSAGFALALTCILRPAAIMTMPGDKKNKDDKKYAAAHSIASGAMGYVMSLIVSKPISKAINKIVNNPKDYIKNKDSYLFKNSKSMLTGSTYLNRVPDILIAAPKAIITVALIPPILKYVFGWEKKKPKDVKNEALFPQDYATLNFKSANAPQKKVFQNFMGGAK